MLYLGILKLYVKKLVIIAAQEEQQSVCKEAQQSYG